MYTITKNTSMNRRMTKDHRIRYMLIIGLKHCNRTVPVCVGKTIDRVMQERRERQCNARMYLCCVVSSSFVHRLPQNQYFHTDILIAEVNRYQVHHKYTFVNCSPMSIQTVPKEGVDFHDDPSGFHHDDEATCGRQA